MHCFIWHLSALDLRMLGYVCCCPAHSPSRPQFAIFCPQSLTHLELLALCAIRSQVHSWVYARTDLVVMKLMLRPIAVLQARQHCLVLTSHLSNERTSAIQILTCVRYNQSLRWPCPHGVTLPACCCCCCCCAPPSIPAFSGAKARYRGQPASSSTSTSSVAFPP